MNNIKGFLILFMGLILGFYSFSFAQNSSATTPSECKGVKLNTNVPFIGNCIENSEGKSEGNTTKVTKETAFPALIGGLTKIVITLILVVGLLMFVAGGVMIAADGMNPGSAKKGKDLIWKVVIGIILLGTSGIILHVINPNFFK